MNFFKDYISNILKNNIIYYSIIIIEFIIIIILLLSPSKKNNEVVITNEEVKESVIVDNNNDNEDVIIDIKGAVKNPGVYKVNKKTIINDAIATAGGLTKNASTININLSEEVIDRMVIYIATKKELEKDINPKTNNITVENKPSNDIQIKNDASIDNTKSVGIETKIETKEQDKEETNTLISINKATKEELITLPSIGEAKADKIIAYREENGLFKNIEDIKNVSGIGDSLFEKIKDYITL